MYAVIQTGGKQYRVSEGDVIEVNHIGGSPGDAVEFTQILMLEQEGTLKVKKQELGGFKVVGKILADKKGKKIRVFRYRRRKNTMRTKGSRAKYTTVTIEKILES
jgi:large subunit ribosomal protein L21